MFTLPAEVKVAPIVYAVQEDTRTAIDGVYGSVLYADSTISLQPGLSPSFQEVILWHEMIHIALSQAGYRDHNEEVIHAIAVGVVRILQDNPALRE